VAFGLLFVFLRVNYPHEQDWRQRLAKIDVAGNVIFSSAIISMLIALTWAGTVYGWSNYRIIVPLVVGFFGIGVWIVFEWAVSSEPSFPRKIVSNRTSAAVLSITFLHSFVIYGGFYFLPVYFQAVKGTSPFVAGNYQHLLSGEKLCAELTRLRNLHSSVRRGPSPNGSRWRRPTLQMGPIQANTPGRLGIVDGCLRSLYTV
jgi:hypothetical protein